VALCLDGKILGHDIAPIQLLRPNLESRLLPGEDSRLPDGVWTMAGPGLTYETQVSLQWTLFIDDAPPISGLTDLCDEMRRVGGPHPAGAAI
jgi:hypothetical protein